MKKKGIGQYNSLWSPTLFQHQFVFSENQLMYKMVFVEALGFKDFQDLTKALTLYIYIKIYHIKTLPVTNEAHLTSEHEEQ